MTDGNPVLIGYARVSTEDQELRLQTEALRSAGVALRRIYSDKASGGAGAKRPGLAAAIKALRRGDTLVCWKLDRLARSLTELLQIGQAIDRKAANLRVLTMAMDTGTPGGRLLFHVFGAFAEFERELIRERTTAGLAAARKAGRKGGRARVIMGDAEDAIIADLLAGMPVSHVSAKHGVSRTHLYTRIRGEWAQRLSGAENGK
jgi:DNA invertase Pin-like site-specific DNA recombinase